MSPVRTIENENSRKEPRQSFRKIKHTKSDFGGQEIISESTIRVLKFKY